MPRIAGGRSSQGQPSGEQPVTLTYLVRTPIFIGRGSQTTDRQAGRRAGSRTGRSCSLHTLTHHCRGLRSTQLHMPALLSASSWHSAAAPSWHRPPWHLPRIDCGITSRGTTSFRRTAHDTQSPPRLPCPSNFLVQECNLYFQRPLVLLFYSSSLS